MLLLLLGLSLKSALWPQMLLLTAVNAFFMSNGTRDEDGILCVVAVGSREE